MCGVKAMIEPSESLGFIKGDGADEEAEKALTARTKQDMG